jgi:UDP-N-acetylmuramate dehydrogenase
MGGVIQCNQENHVQISGSEIMIEDKIQSMVSLAPLTTFKIGGPARFFLIIDKKEELPAAFAWAKKNNIKVLILGGGSNVLVNDRGVDALVLKVKNKGLVLKDGKVEAAAGEDLAKLVNLSQANNLSGLEWAAGIPGTIGGAIRGNAGAYGSSISESIFSVEVFNLLNLNFEIYSPGNCRFSYRQSIFSNKNLFIWSAIIELKAGEAGEINDKMKKNITDRSTKLPKLPSAGSVFKNIDYEILLENNGSLAKLAQESNIVKGNKVGAGWLIDQLDLKGKKIGGAKVSLEHGNFIVNTGNATTEDVIMLISFIKQQVRTKLNVQLYEEIEYFGL